MREPAVSTMVRPEGAPIDFDALRAARRRRLLDAMAAHRLDALILGRPANAFYASGANQLWTAGARPFGPTCIVLADGGRVHLLSTWDEGVPEEIAHDELFGLSWNPANIVASVARIEGLGRARRIGTDSLSPGFGGLIGVVAPGAEVVDANPALRAARAVKTDDEVRCIVTATAIAESGLAAMTAALRPGVSERELVAVYLERIASLGAPTPPTEGVACATTRHGPVALRRLASARAAAPGELVVLDPGARFAAYEGGLGRTRTVGAPSPAATVLAERAEVVLEALIDACRPGATGADLRRAWERTGEPLPSVPLAYGVGLGMEAPVVTADIGDTEVLLPGMVLALTSWVAQPGVGGVLERELVAVRDDGAEVLSRYARGIT